MMKNYLAALLLLVVSQFGFSQANRSWKGYFSYNEIKDLAQSPTVLYAAAENALFSINLNTNVIKTTTTVDGLSGQTITALYHSETLNKTMVGYDNGLIIVINEVDGSMLNVVDIINKQLPSNIKRVNHFMEYNNIVYVSCDFGIVQYNLATLGFGDTYFIGNNGAEIIVSQTAVYNNEIYAATSSGIRRALVTNPNLVDFSQWTSIAGGVWNAVETFGSELVAVNSGGQVSRFNGTTFSALTQLPAPFADLRASGGNLVITTSDRAYVYNTSFGIVAQVESDLVPEMTAVFTCATVIGDTIFIGTLDNGVVTAAVSNPLAFDYISPDGPSRNNIFSINKETENLWAVYGDYTVQYDPNPLRSYGISKYNTEGWLNIPYAEVHPVGSEAYDFVRVTVNPSNPTEVFVSSYFSGLFKFQDDILSTVYNASNSGLESIFPPSPDTDIRIEQSAFDRSGNLWMTNGLLNDPLKVLKTDGSWQSYNMESILGLVFRHAFRADGHR
jgi:hypothetical protein